MGEAKPTLVITASTFPRWEADSEPRFVYDLSRRLTAWFNVVVLAPHAAGAKTTELWHGMQIYRYRYAPTAWETLAYNGGITANLKQKPWKMLLLPLFFAGQCWALHKLLKTYPVTTVHAHWLIPQGLTAALALWGKSEKPALICTSHGGDLFGLQDAISRYLKRWVVQRCQALTVVSHAMLPPIHALTNANPPPIKVIPMGTDLQQTFIPNPKISRASNQLLFVGRLVEKKGLPYLLQALQQLLPQHPDLQLIVAGSGTAEADLMQLVASLGLSQQVRFVGRLEHTSLVHLYQSSTLAVFPFIQAKDGDMEGLGLVMIEAMGCGCPVIASDLPAVRDVIRDGETGQLVTAADSAALAATIASLLANPAQRQALSAQALATVRHSFDWETVTEAYAQVLLQSLAQKRSTPPLPLSAGGKDRGLSSSSADQGRLGEASPMRVCGLMLAYFHAEMTLRCLKTLEHQGLETLILVDNSADAAEHQRTLALVQQFPAGWLQVVIAAENLGFAKGMNLAWQHAQTLGQWDYALILNNDIIAQPPLLASLCQYMAEHPDTALLGVAADTGTTIQTGLHYQRWTGLMFPTAVTGSFQVATGYCLLLRPQAIQGELFDPRYFMYGEDVELSWRLGEQGWKVEILSQPLLTHTPAQSSREGSLFYEYHINRGHWLLVANLAHTPLEKILMYASRILVLSMRAILRSARMASLTPLKALVSSKHQTVSP